MRDWSEGQLGVDVGTVRINTALLPRQQEQQLSFRGDLATSPLLIAMPPYRQVPMHAWVRQKLID